MKKILGRILLVTVSLILGYYIFIPITSDLVMGIRDSRGQNIIVGLKLTELSGSEIGQIEDIPDWERDYANQLGVPVVTFSLDYIYIPSGTVLSGNKFCINEIVVSRQYGQEKQVENKILVADPPVCLGEKLFYGRNKLISHDGKNTKPGVFIYESVSNEFWYPFDFRITGFDVQVTGTFTDKSGNTQTTFQPTIRLGSTPPLWLTTLSKGTNGTMYAVKLTRPWVYKILFVLIPIAVILILWNLRRVVKEKGSFWEVTVALALGLSGLTELFIPDYINYPTFAGSVLSSLYLIIFTFIIYITSIYFNNIRRKSNNTEPRRTRSKQGPTTENVLSPTDETPPAQKQNGADVPRSSPDA